MGRPPCCDKVGIKKGPWTPEEDIILVSYIQEHGPGNWRSVPTNTGLSRCSKSCRLRWTNYLRPGIKRGNFTPHEEGMIIHLQALLGNKWAAIASYLPQRTDNDIKNYWNTHLKKKLKKLQVALDPHLASDSTTTGQFPSKSFNDTKSLDIITTTTTTSSINNHHHHASSLRPSQSQSQTQSSSTTYASSTENISRLLEGWMRTSPKPLKETQLQERFHQSINDGERGFKSGSASATAVADASDEFENSNNNNNNKLVKSASLPAALNLHHHHQHKTKDEHNEGGEMVSHEEYDSILSFENLNSSAWDKSTCDSMPENKAHHHHHNNINMAEKNNANAPPLSFLEKWLLDENVGHVEEMMELSPMF